MKNRTNAYWINRSEQVLSEAHKNSDSYIQHINAVYNSALQSVQKDINKIFQVYANEHKLTAIEAKKLLNESISPKEIEYLRKELTQISNTELKKHLLAQLNANAYKARITRLEALKQVINTHYLVVADKQIQLSTGAYVNTIKDSYYKHIFEIQKGLDIGFNVAQLPTKTIDLMLNRQWIDSNYSSRVWKNTNILADKLSKTITSGMISGKSIPKMVKELEELSDYGKYAAERLVRTETTYFSNQASMESYKECDIDKYIFIATLDLRTSKQCRQHDRKVYLVAKAVPGENLPPLHTWCRSTTRAYLGQKYMNNIKRRARDPETGRTHVIGSMNYTDWYNQYVKGNPRALTAEQKINNMSIDKKQYKEYRKVLGKEAPKSIDAFQDLKYTDSKKWENLNDFYKSRKNNMISGFTTFSDYEGYKERVNNELVGLVTEEGLQIKGQSKHLLERVFGTTEDPKTGLPRSGVEIEAVRKAILNGTVRKRKSDPNSIKLITDECMVSINPHTGILIQVNPQ